MDWFNNNLHIIPINTFIDPYKPVQNAIITHAHSDHAKQGHTNVLATRETIEIMKIRYGENCAKNFQTLKYNHKLNINGFNITFFPAGHILGSCQILIEHKGKKVNVTGDFKIEKDTTCENFEQVICDTLVTEATFGLPIFHHPKPQNEIQKLFRSLKNFPERPHLVGVYALGKSQRLIKLIRQFGYDEKIFIHGALEKLCDYYKFNGIDLGRLEKTSTENIKEYNGKIILSPPSAISGKWSQKFNDPIVAHASGWMTIKQRAKQRRVELPLVISDHADWDELKTNIVKSNSNKVLVTHGRSDGLVHWCKTKGIKAMPLSLLGRDEEGDE